MKFERGRNELTVQGLHDLMEQMIEEGKEDYVIRMLHQPNWPFVLSVGNVSVVQDDSCETEEVYLCEGKQLGYGPKFEDVGEQYWGR